MIAAGAIPAADIRVGSQQALAVYAGEELVWEAVRGQLDAYISLSSAQTVRVHIFNRTGPQVTIDWGDGSQSEVAEVRGETYLSHNYNAGDYKIRVSKRYQTRITFYGVVNESDQNITNRLDAFGRWYLRHIDQQYYTLLTTANIRDCIVQVQGFALCRALSSLTVDSKTQIEPLAFEYSGLSNGIEIPSSVIGFDAFRGCTGLTKVWLRDTVEKANSTIFEGVSNVVIYCEADSKPDRWATDWNVVSSAGDATTVYAPVVWGQKTRPW